MMLDALMGVYADMASDMFETMGEWAERWQMLFAGMDLWMPFRPADGVAY